MKSRVLIMCLMLISLVRPTFAASPDGPTGGRAGELRYNWKMDLAVTSIAAAGWITTWAAMGQLAPDDCRWCQVNSFDDWGHRNIKWSDTSTASRISDVTAYALAPIAAYGLDALAASHDGRLSNFWIDALLITEAAALSSFATQLVKIAVGRQRPYAHYGGGSTKARDNISFYSGHTSLAFSLAVSSGTIATMRGYRMAPWIWGAGLAVAATTSYFRLAADKHYLTDTIAGAVLGSAFGFGIPYLFHRPKDDGRSRPIVSAAPTQGGALLTVSGKW